MRINEIDTPKNNDLFDLIIETKYFNENILPYITHNTIPPQLVHGSYNMDVNRVITIHERKGPTDSAKIIHQIVNEESEKKFGVKIRNMIFATQSPEASENYGSLRTLIPLDDDYALYYNDIISDMYSDSNGVFEFSKYREKRSDIIMEALKSPKGVELQKAIYNKLTGGTLTNMILSYITPYTKSISFYDGNLEDNIYPMDSLEEMKDVSNWQHVRKNIDKYIVMSMKSLIINEGIYDIEDINMRYASNEIIELSNYLIENLIPSDIKELELRAYLYVSDVKKTSNLHEIPESHEIMCTTGRYAILDTFEGGMDDLVKYYKQKYQ